MEEILALATGLGVVTGGVIEALKRAIGIDKRYVPLAAMLVGVLLGAAAYFMDAEIGIRMWAGGISGLIATGVFENIKNIKKRSG